MAPTILPSSRPSSVLLADAELVVDYTAHCCTNLRAASSFRVASLHITRWGRFGESSGGMLFASPWAIAAFSGKLYQPARLPLTGTALLSVGAVCVVALPQTEGRPNEVQKLRKSGDEIFKSIYTASASTVILPQQKQQPASLLSASFGALAAECCSFFRLFVSSVPTV